MSSWVSEHREDIKFLATMIVGGVLVIIGIIWRDFAVLAFGGGALGVPGMLNFGEGRQ